MSFTFEEADEYAAAHSTPATEVLRRLGEETEKRRRTRRRCRSARSRVRSSGFSSR